MPDRDVIVVGAGPVGLLAACLLLQRGYAVTVCEKHEGPDLRTRAIGIHPPGLAALEEAGVGAEVRAEALALGGGDVLSRGRMLASIDFSEERRVLVLAQQRTGGLLRERLAALDPRALRLGCTALSLRDEGEFARLTVDGREGRRELTASLIVLADGVRSTLRGSLDAGWRARKGAATYAMADVPDDDAGERALLHCEPGGLVESFPLPGGARRWVAREQDESLQDPDAFRAAITKRIGGRVEIPKGVRPVVFRAAQHRAEHVVHGRIVLLGDAAHEISPIGGQGMNLGWLAARHLVAAIGDLRAPDLRPFASWSAGATRRVQRRAGFYMSMGAPSRGMPLRLREGLIRSLGSSPLRDRTRDVITMGGLD